jgi:hypothetical protein
MDSTEDTVFCCQECVFTGPLPSNGCPSIVESVCCGNVFTDPLPSNGYTRHSIFLRTTRLTYKLCGLKVDTVYVKTGLHITSTILKDSFWTIWGILIFWSLCVGARDRSSWLKHYATSRKVAGSISGEVVEFFQFI